MPAPTQSPHADDSDGGVPLPPTAPIEALDPQSEPEVAAHPGDESLRADGRPDPYAAMRVPGYRAFVSGFAVSSIGLQMMGAALLWEVWERTHSFEAIVHLALARVAPVLLLALPAGQVIDTFSRKRVLIVTQIAFALAVAGLAAASMLRAPMPVIYGLVMLIACARVFNGPSRSALLPMIVPPAVFHNAVTWNSGVFHFAAIAGPVLAGLMLNEAPKWFGVKSVAWPVYAITTAACLVFALTATRITTLRPQVAADRVVSLRSLFGGVGFMWREKTVLAAITLDLFAVIFGGATALLPMYCDYILDVGPREYGLLRAATAIGALLMAVVLARRAPFRRPGVTLLLAVAGFGLCTVVFGYSEWFWLSFAALLGAGALDNISVVIRHVLVQVRTPDQLRGRVASVNTIFIESSNELGSVESSLVAGVLGPVFAAVSGGVGTVLVCIGVWFWLPQLRGLGQLREVESDDGTTASGVSAGSPGSAGPGAIVTSGLVKSAAGAPSVPAAATQTLNPEAPT